MPQRLAPGKVERNVTVQTVLISFDDCVDIESWNANNGARGAQVRPAKHLGY